MDKDLIKNIKLRASNTRCPLCKDDSPDGKVHLACQREMGELPNYEVEASEPNFPMVPAKNQIQMRSWLKFHKKNKNDILADSDVVEDCKHCLKTKRDQYRAKCEALAAKQSWFDYLQIADDYNYWIFFFIISSLFMTFLLSLIF